MASKQSVVNSTLEQVAADGVASVHPMLGKYRLYCRENCSVLVCNDKLFVKSTKSRHVLLGEAVTECPVYPGAKPCFVIPGDQWENSDCLTKPARTTMAKLPAAKARE